MRKWQIRNRVSAESISSEIRLAEMSPSKIGYSFRFRFFLLLFSDGQNNRIDLGEIPPVWQQKVVVCVRMLILQSLCPITYNFTIDLRFCLLNLASPQPSKPCFAILSVHIAQSSTDKVVRTIRSGRLLLNECVYHLIITFVEICWHFVRL